MKNETKQTAVQKIAELQSKIQAETESLKGEFLNQLFIAAETYKLLKSLGVDMTDDQLFQESVSVFGMSTPRTARKPRQAKSGEVKTTILEVVKAGKSLTHSEIKDGVSKKLGKEIGNQYSTLNALVKNGVLTKDGERYSLKKN